MLAALASIRGVKARRMCLPMRPANFWWVCGFGCLCRLIGDGAPLLVLLTFPALVMCGRVSLVRLRCPLGWGITVRVRILFVLSSWSNVDSARSALPTWVPISGPVMVLSTEVRQDPPLGGPEGVPLTGSERSAIRWPGVRGLVAGVAARASAM